MARAACHVPGCTVGADGRCFEGFVRLDDCPNIAGSRPGPRVSEPVAEQGAWIELPDGAELDSRAAERVARSAVTRVILLAGAADSGKTTLLAALYESFQHGSFAGYLFAGSEALLGFERRCHLGRIDCGRPTSDTARSSVSAGQRWLHLRVRPEGSDRPPRDLLFSEIGGDFVRMAKDSTEECRRLTIMRRADHFLILIDGARLAQPRNRLTAVNDAGLLLRSCLDAEMLGPASFVDILFTKWDVVTSNADLRELDPFLAAFTERTRQHCEARLGRLRFFRLAARPTAASRLAFGDGMPSVVVSWVEDSPALGSRVSPTLPMPDGLSEFDRYLWRQMATLRPGT